MRVQGADQNFATEKGSEASSESVKQVCSAVLDFAHELVKLGPAPAVDPVEYGAASNHGKLCADLWLLRGRAVSFMCPALLTPQI